MDIIYNLILFQIYICVYISMDFNNDFIYMQSIYLRSLKNDFIAISYIYYINRLK